MITLTVRTDSPEAEIGLFEDTTQIDYLTWHAHRELSVTLQPHIEELLLAHGKSLQDIDAIVGYAGPGSFTGLRIGLTIVNALAYGLGGRPVVAIAGEDNWIQRGIARIQAGDADAIALPEYGRDPRITIQKK